MSGPVFPPVLLVAVDFNTIAIATAANIPTAVQLIRTSGYYAPGDGGGAEYKRVGSAPSHAIWFQSADGAYWTWADNPNNFSILQCGAKGDCSYTWQILSTTGGVLSGTDNATFIQNALDAHVYFGLGTELLFPSGTYLISKGLNVGYGCSYAGQSVNGFATAHIKGIMSFNGMTPGTTLVCNFCNQPAVSIQGVRGADWNGVSLAGLNTNWIYSSGFGSFSYAGGSGDDTAVATWLDPAITTINANAAGRYTPYAAIAIDPYSGTQPSPHYPDLTFPSFLGGGITQYGKSYSSDILIQNASIIGFDTAIVDQPSGANGNGDFVKIERMVITQCKYGISFCADQQRNAAIRDVNFGYVFSSIMNNIHGKQDGEVGGDITNCSWGECINIFSLGTTSYSGPIRFNNCYSEALWSIGSCVGGSSGETSISFNDCNFGFDSQNSTRGCPAYLISGSSQGPSIIFNGGRLGNYASVVVFSCLSLNLTINSTLLLPNTLRPNLYEKFAHNCLAAGVVTNLISLWPKNVRIQPHYTPQWLATPSISQNLTTLVSPQLSSRAVCSSVYSQSLVESSVPDGPPVALPTLLNTLSPSTLTNQSLSGRTLTFTLPSSSFTPYSNYYKLMLNGPMPGDVIWEPTAGTVAFVKSIDMITGTVVAILQNNYGGSNAAFTPQSFPLNSGFWYIINARCSTPQYATFANTSASPSLVSVGRADGYATYLAKDVIGGDYIYVDMLRDYWIGNYLSMIHSCSPSGTILLDGSARQTWTAKRLNIFIQPGDWTGIFNFLACPPPTAPQATAFIPTQPNLAQQMSSIQCAMASSAQNNNNNLSLGPF
jgi:hypothetical protein